MPTTTTLAHLASFEDILDELELLSRTQLLIYRVQVGAVFLTHFWDDTPAAFSSKNPHRTQRFELFFNKYEDALTRYGLSRRMAQDSVRACIVMRTLPTQLAERLFLTQVLVLGTVHDLTLRARLAQRAVERDWSMPTLRAAIMAVRAGVSLEAVDDDSAAAAGEEPTTSVKQLPPGRLVTRAEKLPEQVRSWAAQWAAVDVSQLPRKQRERLAAAVTELEAEVAALRVQLGAGLEDGVEAGGATAEGML